MDEAQMLAKLEPEWREWTLRLKAEIEKRGCSIEILNAEVAQEQKRRLRRGDQLRLKKGLTTPEELQRKNTLFGSDLSQARLLGYGALEHEPIL